MVFFIKFYRNSRINFETKHTTYYIEFVQRITIQLNFMCFSSILLSVEPTKKPFINCSHIYMQYRYTNDFMTYINQNKLVFASNFKYEITSP